MGDPGIVSFFVVSQLNEGFSVFFIRYPIYVRGNPQLRIFLPNFWMRLVKPEHRNSPPNVVHFEVSSQMTRLDVKNYLTQIYKIPAMDVKTFNFSGENYNDSFKQLSSK